jgi:hypothetical protein
MKTITKALILISTLSFIFSCQKKEEFAVVKVEKKEIDFGTISPNDTVNKTFKLLNTSDVPLKISKLGTSCGCTGAIISDSIINKGEYAEIKASFKPRKGESGAVKNSIVVEANTNPPYTALYMKGNVIIQDFN